MDQPSISLLDAITLFFGANWGNIASVIGAILTIFFSWSASNSSKLSRQASEQTKKLLQSVDLLSETNRLLGRVDDLLFRLEHQAWIVVVERATDLRISTAAIISQSDDTFSLDTKQRLGEAVNQFKNIASGADRVAQGSARVPDAARYRRIVSDQKETLVLAAQELKTRLGEEQS